MRTILLLGAGALALSACGNDEGSTDPRGRPYTPIAPAPPFPTPPGPTPTPTPTPAATTVTFSFDQFVSGWTPDYSDYRPGMEQAIEFSSSIAALPAELGGARALRLSSLNASSDVAMYLTRPVEGLTPGRRYRVETSVTIATNTLAGCAGAGAPPGEGITVKLGAGRRQPAKAVDARGVIVANFDKGDQSSGGTEVVAVGDLATPDARSCTAGVYATKSFTSAGRGPIVTADADGRTWLVIATDTAFQGRTTIYVLNGRATLTEA